MMMTMMGWGSSSTSSKDGWRKGPWTPEEDKLLSEYVRLHGEGRWSSVSKSSGLKRSGKSCRLRWVNYLRPGLKRGQITPQEEGIIIELHALWGNKWSTIARYLPGRTDNEIKNYWRTHFKKKDKNPINLKQQKRKALLKQQQHQEQSQQQPQPQPQQSAATDAAPSVMNSIEGADHCYPVITPDSTSSWSDFLGEDAILLEGLWNLDDMNNNAQVDHFVNCNKMAIHNNPAALGGFSHDGDGDYGFGNNGGYYIF